MEARRTNKHPKMSKKRRKKEVCFKKKKKRPGSKKMQIYQIGSEPSKRSRTQREGRLPSTLGGMKTVTCEISRAKKIRDRNKKKAKRPKKRN